jgi:hypothetical protein
LPMISSFVSEGVLCCNMVFSCARALLIQKQAGDNDIMKQILRIKALSRKPMVRFCSDMDLSISFLMHSCRICCFVSEEVFCCNMAFPCARALLIQKQIGDNDIMKQVIRIKTLSRKPDYKS